VTTARELYRRTARLGASAKLECMQPEWATTLADGLATLDPWLDLKHSAQAIKSVLTDVGEPDAATRCLLVEGEPAGAVSVLGRWLLGPYLRHLSVLPQFQRRGFGRAMLMQIERETRPTRARNLWVCATSTNDVALALYRSVGFKDVGVLDDLLVRGHDEILLRKRLG
jgi:ribosomal protein S18 acetylase RimI-like enzyme